MMINLINSPPALLFGRQGPKASISNGSSWQKRERTVVIKERTIGLWEHVQRIETKLCWSWSSLGHNRSLGKSFRQSRWSWFDHNSYSSGSTWTVVEKSEKEILPSLSWSILLSVMSMRSWNATTFSFYSPLANSSAAQWSLPPCLSTTRCLITLTPSSSPSSSAAPLFTIQLWWEGLFKRFFFIQPFLPLSLGVTSVWPLRLKEKSPWASSASPPCVEWEISFECFECVHFVRTENHKCWTNFLEM